MKDLMNLLDDILEAIYERDGLTDEDYNYFVIRLSYLKGDLTVTNKRKRVPNVDQYRKIHLSQRRSSRSGD